ncbi:hypothetical protein KKH18_07815, partial [bacterium]|nr:hypothetical protein [bacterium]
FAGVQLEALPTLGELVEVLPLTDSNGRTTGSVAGIYDNHSGLCVMVSDGIVLGEDCMHEN